MSAMPAKAPNALSCSIWFLDSLLQQDGKLLNGNEGLSLALFHRVQRCGFAQTMDGNQRAAAGRFTVILKSDA